MYNDAEQFARRGRAGSIAIRATIAAARRRSPTLGLGILEQLINMAMGWVGSFKNIPWTRVLTVAPSVVDGARKLWSSVTRKDALIKKPPIPPEEKVYSPDPTILAIVTQMHALELRTAQLGEEIVLSSEVIDKLAEQQSQLVQAVDILRVRTRALLWICCLIVLAIVVLIYLVVGR